VTERMLLLLCGLAIAFAWYILKSALEMDELMDAPDLRRLAHLAQLSPEDLLEELLAVIHRDGGHYADEVGLPKAVLEAERLVMRERSYCPHCAVRDPLFAATR
jgi:hypothetical protein